MPDLSPIVRTVVQARMSSTRLPGKVLAPLAGEPMLAHIVRRLERVAEHVDGRYEEVIVATSDSPVDQAIEQMCRRLGVPCCRGSEDDVLARYVTACADLRDDDVVLRATADNPLYCSARTGRLVSEFLVDRLDYLGIENLSYAVPEAIRVGALRRCDMVATDTHSREHVTPYLRRRPPGFRTRILPATWSGLRTDVRLTVDTPDDRKRMERIFAALYGGDPFFTVDEVFRLCDSLAERSKPQRTQRARRGFESLPLRSPRSLR